MTHVVFIYSYLESESDFDGVTVRYATRMPKRENVLESEGSFFSEEAEAV